MMGEQAESVESSTEVLEARLVALVMTGILCLGMALGLEIYPHFAGRGLVPQRLEVNEDRLPEAQSTPAAPAAPAPRGLLTFAELMQFLSPRRADPAGARFAREFMASAPLKSVYAEFSAGPGDRPATEFVAALQRAPEFGEDFRAVAAIVTRNPEVNRLLRGLKKPGAPEDEPMPEFAPSGKSADTLGAEAGGKVSPISRLKAPGEPLEAPAPDR